MHVSPPLPCHINSPWSGATLLMLTDSLEASDRGGGGGGLQGKGWAGQAGRVGGGGGVFRQVGGRAGAVRTVLT